MSDEHFLKGNCQNCACSFEFPAQGVGVKIECPSCGQETLLSEAAEALAADLPVPSEVATEASSELPEVDVASPVVHKKRSPLVSSALVLVALAAAGGVWYFTAGPGAKKPEEQVAKSAPTNPTTIPSTPSTPATPVTNPPADRPAEANNPDTAAANSEAVASKPPKSIDDLKPGPVTIEKAKSGSLMHAVGTIKNTSGQQRFGVRVELELTDARGNPAGKARDYTQVIEPRQEWRFRALVLDPKGSRAVSGKVSSIKEDD